MKTLAKSPGWLHPCQYKEQYKGGAVGLVISRAINRKLSEKHGVSRDEVVECFGNRGGVLLEDSREEHRTEPPTRWFIAETDHGRWLKVVFVTRKDGKIFLKTAYEPNDKERDIYDRANRSRGAKT